MLYLLLKFDRSVFQEIQAVLQFRSDEEIARAKEMGVEDVNRVYKHDDLAKGEVMFVATGVTDGSYLRGVRFTGGGATTNSIVMRSESGTFREISANHQFSKKPNYGW